MRRQHIDCGGPKGIDSGYPYPTNQIADGTAAGYYGFDTVAAKIVWPTSARDFMTYCNPEWVSDYTYRATLAWMKARYGVSALREDPLPTLAQDVLALSGTIETAADTGATASVSVSEGAGRVPGSQPR